MDSHSFSQFIKNLINIGGVWSESKIKNLEFVSTYVYRLKNSRQKKKIRKVYRLLAKTKKKKKCNLRLFLLIFHLSWWKNILLILSLRPKFRKNVLPKKIYKKRSKSLLYKKIGVTIYARISITNQLPFDFVFY